MWRDGAAAARHARHRHASLGVQQQNPSGQIAMSRLDLGLFGGLFIWIGDQMTYTFDTDADHTQIRPFLYIPQFLHFSLFAFFCSLCAVFDSVLA
jgi:hypothetical protein